MDSNIYGRNGKLYGAKVNSRTQSDVINAFSTATFLKIIPMGFPMKDGAGTNLGAQNYLYRSGTYETATDTLWTNFSSVWKTMPILLVNVGYTGLISWADVTALFPNSIIYGTLDYDVFYVTDDDLEYCQAIYVGPASLPATYGFHKTTLSPATIYFLNFAVFGNMTFTSRMWCELLFVNNITNDVPQLLNKFSVGYNLSEMNNSWWMQAQLNASMTEYTGFEENYVIYKPPEDPYEGAGASGPGGGDGTFDFSSTPVDFPGLPTVGAFSTGFINVYVPTASDLRSLASYMWSGSFDPDNFKKLLADPMDAIMGLSIVPVTASEIGVQSTTLYVGNISTGIAMNAATSQYVSVDCGTVEMPAKWGAYLDFSPYSKLELYLPYIGFVDISPDDVMTANMGGDDTVGSISVQYHVDIISGSCIAFVKCRDHVLYEYGGSCSCGCPVTSGQYKNGLFGILDIISSAGKGVAGVASGIEQGGVAGIAGAVGAGADALTNIGNTAISMAKPAITRSGTVGGSNGLMGYQIPYLVLTVPRMCIPGSQNTYIGYPSFVTLEMSELSGYTQIQVTHLHNMSCTMAEIEEIISLLGSGVIF